VADDDGRGRLLGLELVFLGEGDTDHWTGNRRSGGVDDKMFSSVKQFTQRSDVAERLSSAPTLHGNDRRGRRRRNIGSGGTGMNFTIKHIIALAAVAAAFALGSPAHAEDWKAVGQFGWFAVGKVYPIEKGHFYWVGEYSGTFFNDKGEGSLFHMAGVKCPAFNDLDTNAKKNKAGGYCIITDRAGDQAYLSWRCEGDTLACHNSFEYTGGTGKYKGITGQNTFTGHIEVNWQDGTSTGYATWNR
jgi:hypothetical protein